MILIPEVKWNEEDITLQKAVLETDVLENELLKEYYGLAVENYNEVYYKPMKKQIDELYEKKLLSKDKNLDEKLEYEMYELWHHEGRRARFGAAMMAPDYAWWHGFYELKKRCLEMDEQIEELLESGKPARVHDIKGATGDTTKPQFDKK